MVRDREIARVGYATARCEDMMALAQKVFVGCGLVSNRFVYQRPVALGYVGSAAVFVRFTCWFNLSVLGLKNTDNSLRCALCVERGSAF